MEEIKYNNVGLDHCQCVAVGQLDKLTYIVYKDEDKASIEKALVNIDTKGRKVEVKVVDFEEFKKYKEQADAQKRERELRAHLDDMMAPFMRLYRNMPSVYAGEGMPRLYHDTTKTTIMKGFTQVKGRKHLSKKKRKQLKSK